MSLLNGTIELVSYSSCLLDINGLGGRRAGVMRSPACFQTAVDPGEECSSTEDGITDQRREIKTDNPFINVMDMERLLKHF